MKRRLSCILAAGLCLLALTATTALAQFSSYILPGDQVFPEGIAYQASTGDFYVSSTTDGAIFRGNVAQPEARVWLAGGTEGLTGSRGMKVDARGRLLVSAGPQGMVFVFDTASGQLINKFSTGVMPSFVNDVTIAPDGKAYFTDSQSPFLYRLGETAQGALTLEKWIDVRPAITYTQGFNLGGIVATPDGRYLLVVQGNVGKLYRIDLASKAIAEVDLGGESLLNADGMYLDGQTLWVIRNSDRLLVTVRMGDDFASGQVLSSVADPSFKFPTTLALANNNRLLVVNGQFDRRQGTPDLPFTVSSVPISGQPTLLPTTGASLAAGRPAGLWAAGLIIVGLLTLAAGVARHAHWLV